jgi:hypothetical protein
MMAWAMIIAASTIPLHMYKGRQQLLLLQQQHEPSIITPVLLSNFAGVNGTDSTQERCEAAGPWLLRGWRARWGGCPSNSTKTSRYCLPNMT